MRDKSDAFIVLPGGTGTVDELLELSELKTSGFHSQDIIIVNSDGFYDPIINMLKKIKEENLVREEVDIEKLFKIVYEIDDLIVIFETRTHSKMKIVTKKEHHISKTFSNDLTR